MVVHKVIAKKVTQIVRAIGASRKVSVSSRGYLEKVRHEQVSKIWGLGRYRVGRRNLQA